MDKEYIERLSIRAQSKEWKTAIAEISRQIEELKEHGIHIPEPDEAPGWPHHYVCPACQIKLTFSPSSPHEHSCSVCKGKFHSPEMDKAWVTLLNSWQIERAWSASILALAEKSKEFAELAKRIVMGYVRRYSDYPERNFQNWTWGRVEATGLQEAVWMTTCVKVCRFLSAGGWFTEEELKEIRDKMFVPAIALLRRQTSQVHNIHVWHATAIYAMSVFSGLAEDTTFAEKIIRMNLEKGVLKDGSWFEGSPHYHFYTLTALLEYALAARDAGKEIIMPERIRMMLHAPVQLLLPDRTFPLLNDGWESHPLISRINIYETGQYLFGEFEEILSVIYHECGAKRTSKEALVYGQDKIPPVNLHLKSLSIVDGVAVIRRSETTCLIKANPFGGWHDHPDKPGLYLFKKGTSLTAPDIGNCGYGSPMFSGYYRTTPAHNTIMVDHQEQTPADASIVFAQETPRVTIVQAKTDKAYKGVMIHRTVAVGDGWTIDWCRCNSSQLHTYTWLFHAKGTFKLLNQGLTLEIAKQPVIPNKYISPQQIVKGNPCEIQGCWLERDGGKSRLYVQLWNNPASSKNDIPEESRIAIAESPDLPATKKRGLLISEVRGHNADIIAFFCWGDMGEKSPFVAQIKGKGADFLDMQIFSNVTGEKIATLKIKSDGHFSID